MTEPTAAAESAAPAPQPQTAAAPPSMSERVRGIIAAESGSGRDAMGRYTAQPPTAESGTVPAPAQAEEPQAAVQETGENVSRETPAEAPAAEPEAEPVEIADLNSLAQHLGVEVADLYNLRVPVTDPDGQKTELSLGEWKDAVQTRDRLTKREKELATQREAWESQQREHQQTWAKKLAEADALIGTAEKQLMAEMQSIDWTALRQQNPAEWTALQMEYQAKHQQIQQAKSEVAQRLQADADKFQAEQRDRYTKMVERERALLMEKVPEWKDQTKAEAERRELREFLLERGYTAQEIDNAADHRAILLARDAMKYRAQAKATAEAKKKVVTIAGKVLKPGARQSAVSTNIEAIRQAQQRALQSGGKTDDIAALIKAKRKP